MCLNDILFQKEHGVFNKHRTESNFLSTFLRTKEKESAKSENTRRSIVTSVCNPNMYILLQLLLYFP